MASLGRAFGNIMTYALGSLDMSSAAGDVVVVRHPDGHLASTPFVVRFGRVKVLRPQDKIVTVEVNGETTSAAMKMGSDGTAFWVEPVNKAEAAASDRHSSVSPLSSPLTMSPILGHSPAALADDMPPLGPGATASGAHSVTHSGSLPKARTTTGALSPPSPDRPTGGERRSSVTSADGVATMPPPPPPVTALGDSPNAVQQADDELLQQRKKEYPQLLESFRVEAAASSSSSNPPASPQTTAAAATDDATTDKSSGRRHVDPEASVVEPREGSTDAGGFGNGVELGRGLRLSRFASTENIQEVIEAVQRAEAQGIEADDDDASDDSPDTVAAQRNSALQEALQDGAESDSDGEHAAGVDVARPPSATSSDTPLYRKTLLPTNFELQKLNLREGMNEVKYCVGTSLRGRVEVTARIFMWNYDAVLVISDIDGTITKSDVIGHIASYFGKDWTHEGLCRLFTNIARNNYKFVYLTARSVTQTDATRKFLEGVVQDGDLRLPEGPVFTAPDKLFVALQQELAKKSYEFKIACLTRLKEAFPSTSRPLFAGFGNRIGDVVAYTATGIPKHKIFIINKDSVVHVCEVKQTYRDLAHLVDGTFPAIGSTGTTATIPTSGGPPLNPNQEEDFNSYNFWRFNPADIIEGPPAASAAAAAATPPTTVAEGGDPSTRTSTVSARSVATPPTADGGGAKASPPAAPPTPSDKATAAKGGWWPWSRQSSGVASNTAPAPPATAAPPTAGEVPPVLTAESPSGMSTSPPK